MRRPEYLFSFFLSTLFVIFFAWLENRVYFPAFIVYMVPILLSGYVGGLGPGLLSTFIVALGSDYLQLEPKGSLDIARWSDAVRWMLLVGCGVFSSVICEGLHRAKRRAQTAEQEAARRRELEWRHIERRKFLDRLLAVLEHAPQAMALFDRDMRYLVASPRWVADYHLEDKPIIGRSHYEVFPEIGDSWKAIHQRALHGEVVHSDADRFERSDGSVVYLKWEVRPWHESDGTVGGIIIYTEDITLSQEVENRKSQRERFFELAGFGLAWVDPRRNTFVEVNETFAKQRGYRPEELVGKPVSTIIPPDMHGAFQRTLTKIDEKGHTVLEIEHMRKDGTRFFVMSEITVAKDAWGKPASRLVYAQDLTEKQRADKDLADARNKSAFLASLIENSEQAVVAGIPGAEIVYLNPAFVRLVGHSREQLEKPGFLRSITPDHCRESEDAHLAAAVSADGPIRYEKEYIKKDGSSIPVEIFLHVARDSDGRFLYFYSFITDLTERKRSEEALRTIIREKEGALEEARQNRKHLNRALWAGRLATWDYVFGEENIVVSPNHAELFGVSDPASPWTFERLYAHIHEDDRERVKREFAQAFEGKQEEFSSEFRVRLPDGSIRWLNKRAEIERDGTGKPFHLHGAILDITQLKETELQLHRALSARDEFLSIASHELKTPLTALHLQIQLLQRTVTCGADHVKCSVNRARPLIEGSATQIRRMTALVDDLLDVSRIETGNLKFRPEEVEVSSLVAEALRKVRPQMVEAGCRVEADIERGIHAYWDRLRVEQIFLNLLTNAAKYAPNSPVHVGLSRLGESIVFYVADKGPGVPRDKQNQIFERFERVEGKSRASGMGLGLYIVKKIVAGMKGQITLESEEGKGARFIVQLPLQIHPAAAASTGAGQSLGR